MTDVCLISLGCDKNLVDSEVMLTALTYAGFNITDDYMGADVIIVNTCGFIKSAVKESIKRVIKVGELKSKGRLKALIAAGCMVSRYRDDFLNNLPEVDACVEPRDYGRIVYIIDEILGNITPSAAMTFNIEDRLNTKNSHTAYLKIAEGCDNRCSYCTIWQIKGGYISRDIKSLYREAKNLAETGVKELILAAQDTAYYGADLYGEPRLNILINELSRIDGIEWIRILYAYPEHITDPLINEIKTNKKCLPYIDVPIQHASNRIIKLMGRRSAKDDLTRLFNKLRGAIPDIVIRTTLITGFPGETEEEFAQLLEFIKEQRFDKLGVFTYSREEGTPAAAMPGQILSKDKRRRKDILMKAQRDISKNKLQDGIGRTLRVLTESRQGDIYRGRAYTDAPDIDGAVYFTCERDIKAGEFVDVRITRANEYDLFGEGLKVHI